MSGWAARMGRLYVALGDVDRAFAAFQQACDGESFATDLKIAPDYDAIRSDPRYHALLRCLKLESVALESVALRSIERQAASGSRRALLRLRFGEFPEARILRPAGALESERCGSSVQPG